MESIANNIRRRVYYLNKIEANKINKKPEDDSVKIKQYADYEILENKEEMVAIKLITKFSIEPEALFSIELEHIIEYFLKSPISNDEIDRDINLLLKPLASEVSFIFSVITKDMLNSRIVLPPILNLKDEEN